jgi:YesN/AraC family two-component response regulator
MPLGCGIKTMTINARIQEFSVEDNGGAPPGVNKDVSILFVEDEAVFMLAFVKLLKRRYENVYSAENGEKGLEIFKKHRPTIVFTDILMPRLNGIDLAARIKEISPSTAVVLMTAINEDMYIGKAKLIGIDGYITKPINEDEFFNLLNKIIGSLTSAASAQDGDAPAGAEAR